MAKAEASIEIGAPLAEVWDLYFDPSRWASWVDGFGTVAGSEGYPETGGTLRWHSTPAGRGDVSERVLEHRPRSLHCVAFEDPGAEGELETAFEMLPAGEGRLTRVTQRLAYKVKTGGPLRGITDMLFIRPQMRGSLQRSLLELRLEAERSGSTQLG